MVFEKMGEIIKKRDKIAHGSNVEVTVADVDDAGKHARALLGKLLLRKPQFTSIDSLARWVRKQALLG